MTISTAWGALDLDDYRLDSGALVAEPQLVNHLATRQQHSVVYKRVPMIFPGDALYGGRRKRAASEPDFTLFHLGINRMLLPIDRSSLVPYGWIGSPRPMSNYLLEIFKRTCRMRPSTFVKSGKRHLARSIVNGLSIRRRSIGLHGSELG